MGKNRKKIKKHSTNEILANQILEIFKENKKPLLLREIYHLLHISQKERKRVRNIVKKLVEEGKLVHIRKRRYGLPEDIGVKRGKLRVHPEGFGFVETEEGETIFIPPRYIGKAIDGDLVLVKIYKISPKGPEGKILKILERKRKNIVGYLIRRKKFFFLEPEDIKIPFELYIPKKRKKGAKEGHLVVGKVISPHSEFGVPVGEIIKDLGNPKDLKAHSLAVIYSHDLPYEFPKKVLNQTKKVPNKVREEDKKGRKDLTHLDFVTIDGENARDFDDAIYVEKHKKGFKLFVAIADVSHYVEKNSPLDKEAYLRGTSVYFPEMVVPMFPEKLSNGICSLNPAVERLAMVVEMDFSFSGTRISSKFYPAVIKSKARLTYTQVKRMIVDKDKEVIEKYAKLFPMLEKAGELASLLREKRLARGSLDFDIPEPEVIMKEGHIENIIKRERNLAHMLIEDFMIAANEAVAEFLTEKGYPFLYRVHEPPDEKKLSMLKELLLVFGIDVEFPKEITPSFFQKLIESFSENENAYFLNVLILRSLKQAKYSPENLKHFGLASECYCHFTSPIRRYPDLVVHRTLKRALKEKRPPYKEEDLILMGKHLSERERIAEEAERDILKRYQAFFMKDKIGQTFHGIITGITAFGFFVDLEEYLVSGAVRVIDLPEDIYKINEEGTALVGEKTGKTFHLGQRVKVQVKDVDLKRFFINFVLAE